jgi:hypothetical protein
MTPGSSNKHTCVGCGLEAPLVTAKDHQDALAKFTLNKTPNGKYYWFYNECKECRRKKHKESRWVDKANESVFPILNTLPEDISDFSRQTLLRAIGTPFNGRPGMNIYKEAVELIIDQPTSEKNLKANVIAKAQKIILKSAEAIRNRREKDAEPNNLSRSR